MTAKERLGAYWELVSDCAEARSRLAFIEARINRIGSSALYDSVRLSGGGRIDPMPELLDKKAVAELRVFELELKLTSECFAIDELFCRYLEKDEREVMRLRYFCDLKWDDVLDRLRGSVFACERTKMFDLHNSALKKLLEIETAD